MGEELNQFLSDFSQASGSSPEGATVTTAIRSRVWHDKSATFDGLKFGGRFSLSIRAVVDSATRGVLNLTLFFNI